MNNRTINRMEPTGPHRAQLKEILNNDRRIVSQIVSKASSEVLIKEFHFTDEQIKHFRKHVQAAINRM